MNFIYKTFFIVAFIFSSNVFAQDLNPQQEEDLEKVEQLLRENPQLISNIHRGLQRFLEQQSEQKNAFANHQGWLYQSAAHPILGDKDAPHKIVVFTDYNCPFCKKLEPGLHKLIEEYPSIQVVNIFVPLRQQQVDGLKTNSALYGLNLWRNDPKAFFESHNLMMKKSGMHTADSLQSVAQVTGTEAFLSPSSESEAVIRKNMSAFRELGFRGTPTIIIGQQVTPGYIPYDKLETIATEQFELD
ncbi:DsbA family protein [Idiomarina abyssalis]|uniref:DsbA family protein n=1 Tax=Idiomarina TaxID=135575 RepID=UPI0006C85FC8|nr:DsbA family protein [Idiomarina abyssalis]KPD21791.1 protein-disulfide isomerase [Idiomarina abyssalis]SFT67858.1 Protein-disulfide isomerase [Idiomarina abyssalis]